MSVFDAWTDTIMAKIGKKDTSAPIVGARIPGLEERGFATVDGGMHRYIEPAPEFEATSSQVCGLWPFSVGASSPLIGAPLGKNLLNGSVVCGDPITNFLRGISVSPSGFILALNGRGKSSLAVRIALGCADVGILVMCLGDLKPDFVGLVEELGGQTIHLGPGIGGVNPLDAGPLWKDLTRLSDKEQTKMRLEIHGRRLNTMEGLLELILRSPLQAQNSETTILSIAIAVAAEHCEAQGRQPLVADVREVIAARHERIKANILTTTDTEYDLQVRPLLTGLNALSAHGPFGDVFCNETTVQMRIDQSVNFDVSAIPETDGDLRAAVQLVCWGYGQAGVSAAKTLAKEALEPEYHHLMIMDELWQILRSSELAVHQIDALTRLNRTKGLGQLMITHSMKDLELSDPQLTKIAFGFVERSSMKFLGGLAENEMNLLEQVFTLSEKEKQMLVGWSAEGSVNPTSGLTEDPPGRGRFMLKTGGHPGVPFHVSLTPSEFRIHDTNEAWKNAIAAQQGTTPAIPESGIADHALIGHGAP